MDQSALASDLADLAERLHHAPDSPADTAEEVVGYAREQLGADQAGLSLIRQGGRLQTVAPTDQLVEDADLLQYELGEGPCYDSSWQGQVFVSQDLAEDRRWPLWAPKAVILGIGSVLGVELADKKGANRVGSVNLYWGQPRIFTSEEIAFAHLISRHAALALVNSLTVEGLNVALDSRKRIGQAQGILMERFDLDENQAFAVLKRYSQDHNLKLRELADRISATRRLPIDRRTGRGH